VHPVDTTQLCSQLVIAGHFQRAYLSRPPTLTVFVDGRRIAEQLIERKSDFEITLALPIPLAPGPHEVVVQSSAWYVPHNFTRSGDYRPLAWRVNELNLLP
jgi:hypothetical protein